MVMAGSLYQFLTNRMGRPDGFAEALSSWGRAFPGGIGQGYFFVFPVVFVNDPEIARDSLFAKDERLMKTLPGQESSPGSLLVGKSILMVEGEDWKRHKAALSPSFAWKHVQSVLPEFLIIAQQLKSCWSTAKGGVAPHNFLHDATMDAIGRGGFGYDFNQLEKDEPRHCLGIEDYEMFFKDIRHPLRFFPLLDRLLGTHKAMMKRKSGFESFLDAIITEKRLKIQEASSSGAEWEAVDILDHLLAAGGSETLSSEEIAHNMNTFFIAGHETTASTMNSALHFLSRNPNAQERARSEILEVWDDGELDYEKIKKMTFIDCCIKEALRLMPPVPLLIRSVKPGTLNVEMGSLSVSGGALVGVNVYIIHRDTQLWGEDAGEYKPERFLAENRLKSSRNAFLPFSLGPRQCIGNNFANLEMRIFLSILLKEFRFFPDPHSVPLCTTSTPIFSFDSACTLLIEAIN